jgi:dihydroorotate dehydrogenase (NAD+) catalytic subunit
MLNAIGLENPGVDVFLNEKLPFLRKFDTTVIVNIFGYSLEDYVGVAERLEGIAGVSALEVNISCPNVKAGGIVAWTNHAVSNFCRQSAKNDTAAHSETSPNVADRIREGGADAAATDFLSSIRFWAWRSTCRRRQARGAGGLSGPRYGRSRYARWQAARQSAADHRHGGIMTGRTR